MHFQVHGVTTIGATSQHVREFMKFILEAFARDMDVDEETKGRTRTHYKGQNRLLMIKVAAVWNVERKEN